MGAYAMVLGVGLDKDTGLYHPRLMLSDPEGKVICTAYIPEGYLTREEAVVRLNESIPILLQKCRDRGSKVEVLEVV